MLKHSSNWVNIALLNLLTVALTGLILRYNIVLPLPYINQRNLLHGHSHFAFTGWVTQILLYLLVRQLKHDSPKNIFQKYRPILLCNLIAAYGMLFTFPFQGYGLYSIIFSTISILVSYWFTITFWIDLQKQTTPSIAHQWFRAAICFNTLSSLGIFGLAYTIAKQNMMGDLTQLSLNFFIHFQYNGWFFFACIGLLFTVLEQYIPNKLVFKAIFLLFGASCIPAYLIYTLWLQPSPLVYTIAIAAAISQLVGCFLLFKTIIQYSKLFINISTISKRLFILSALALSLKLLLQSLFILPMFSQYAFGFRPIIIGYLHLVLLGVITIFILSYLFQYELKRHTATTKYGVIVFIAGIILNEVVLMLQGLSGIFSFYIPYFNQQLLATAFLLFIGLLLLNLRFNRNISTKMISITKH